MNIENLTKLANYLDGVEQEKFCMEQFKSECGTVACAAGYLPQATGIEKPTNETWAHYIDRVSIIGGCFNKYYWCFSSEWHSFDNSPRGAAKRIRYMLKNGTPENWCYSEETVGLYQ